MARLYEGIFAWAEGHPFYSVGFISLLILMPGSASLPLLDRDEPRFSRATVEMMERHDWVIPYFNGEFRFDKPPLTYWWMALDYAVLGPTEMAARLHSILCSTLIALLLVWMGSRFFDTRTGLLAGLAWSTCVQVFIHGRLALADMPMILCVASSHWALWKLLTAKDPPGRWGRWFWLLYGSMAVGFLAKGPVALILPWLSLALYRWVFWRKPILWRRLQPAAGWVVALALIGVWGLPAVWLTGGAYWKVGMGRHVIERGAAAFNGRLTLPFYYLATAFVSLFPWVPWVIQGLAAARKNWDARAAFLTSWCVGPYLLFSFYATQLPHYVLPAFPALFLLAFGFAPRGLRRRLFLGFESFYGLILVAGFGFLMAFPSKEPVTSIKVSLGMMVGVLTCLGLFEKGIRTHKISLVAGGLAGCVVLSSALGGALQRLGLTRKVGRLLKESPGQGWPVFAAGFTEPGLVFYAGRPWHFIGLEEALREVSGTNIVLVLQEEYRLEDLLIAGTMDSESPKGARPFRDNRERIPPMDSVANTMRRELQGLNFARPSWVKVVLWTPPVAP